MRKILGLIIILMVASTASAIGYSLHKDSVLELQASNNSPTRLELEGEKIVDMIVYPKEAAEVILHSSGSVMILPQMGANKVYITIFGENNTVQDIAVRFVAKKVAPIRLVGAENKLITQNS